MGYQAQESYWARFQQYIKEQLGKEATELVTVANNEDISGGKTANLKAYKRWTLYLKVAGAIDIKVELSPDDGATWYEIPESPISFSGAGDRVLEMGYDASMIRLTGSNSTSVTAQIVGRF